MTTNLLIGADGAWSRVLPILSGAKPAYVGTTFIETFLYDADNRHRASAQAVGDGALFAVAPGRGVFAHRESDGVLHTYVELNKPRDWIDRIDFSDPAATLARVAAEFDGAELGQAIAANPGDVEGALAAYEKKLFPRRAAEAVEAERILKMCLGPDAPGSLVDFLSNTPPAN